MAVGAVPVQISNGVVGVGGTGVDGVGKDLILNSAEVARPVVGRLLISGLLFDAAFFLLAPASFCFFLLRLFCSGAYLYPGFSLPCAALALRCSPKYVCASFGFVRFNQLHFLASIFEIMLFGTDLTALQSPP